MTNHLTNGGALTLALKHFADFARGRSEQLHGRRVRDGSARRYPALVGDIELGEPVQQYLNGVRTALAVDIDVYPRRAHIAEYLCQLRTLRLPAGGLEDIHQLVGVAVGFARDGIGAWALWKHPNRR